MKKVALFFTILLNLSLFSLFAAKKNYSKVLTVSNFYLNQVDCNEPHFFSCIQGINCNWEFYWDKTPQEVYTRVYEHRLPDTLIKVPSYWNQTKEKITNDPSPYGKASYRVTVNNLVPGKYYGILLNESPATSAAIYVDRMLIYTCGDPFTKNAGRRHSIIKPIYTQFQANNTGTAEIVIYVSNYFYRVGGLWTPVQIGPDSEVYRYYSLLSGISLVCLGILLFICVLNLIQFILNPKQKQYLFLFTITFACITRVATAGFNILNLFFPNLPAEIKVKIEFMAIWVIPSIYYLLLVYLYPKNKITDFLPVKIVRHSYLTVNVFLGLMTLVTPASFANRMVPVIQLTAVIGTVLGLIIIFINMYLKKDYVFYHLNGILFLLGSFVFDIVFVNNKEVLKISFVPIFFVVYSIILLSMLGKMQNQVMKEIENLTDNLQNTNISYVRFVPLEFLSLLKKSSITKIQLGDHSTVEMSILFSKISIFDVRNSRIPDSELQYKIYCEYLGMISPYITRNNGFISKFLSGGIMALFPGIDTADDALYAALKMVENEKRINEKYNRRGIKINVYTGVHYGNMILGTIGDENRLDDTVISDTVNTVSRIESVCERLNKHVIVTEDLFKLTAPGTTDVVNTTYLQPIPVKGKQEALKLIECVAKYDIYVQPGIDVLLDEDDFDTLEEV